ncbi:MAG: hypothetical protein AAF513_15555 [Pseudomonadota bacterium]
MRIHVTGNAGAGKTTLARTIANHLDLPLHHLDTFVWESGWRKPDPQTRSRAIETLTQGPRWIIDGVSPQVRERADLVIVLDTPTRICLYRVVKRALMLGWRTRPELPADCPEIKILTRAVKIVLRFAAQQRQALLREARTREKYEVYRDASALDLKRLSQR